MISDLFQILLWVTAIMLFISGVDDLYLDLLYWFEKSNYNKQLPDFGELFLKPEKPIAIFIGAWKESGVIGRTLTYAVKNLKYENYRFFIGVYPNDPETLKVVTEVSKLDSRIIPCVNSVEGPTTKADNLNLLYAGLIEYEKQYGKFEIIIVHDAEDFLHSNSLKLYNLLLGYKGYHAIQIPVIPIKSRLGGLFHRTYCDAFAEVHTKDMIVRQAMGTFIPFAGTGMGFHRKTFNYLEMNYINSLNEERKKSNLEPFNSESDLSQDLENVKRLAELMALEKINEYLEGLNIENTDYKDDPFGKFNQKDLSNIKFGKNFIKNYTIIFLAFLIGWISFLVYSGNPDLIDKILSTNNINFSPSNAIAKGELSKDLYEKQKLSDTGLPIDEIVNVSNGYTDLKYNVLYNEFEKNKFIIVESSWSNELSAEKRVSEIKASGSFSGKSILHTPLVSNGKNVYRVTISEYNTLADARVDIAKFKQSGNQISKLN